MAKTKTKKPSNKKPEVKYGKPPAALTRFNFKPSTTGGSVQKPQSFQAAADRSGHRGDR